GLKPADMETVGNLICDFLDNPNEEKNKKRVKGGVQEITRKFPMDQFRLD
ncbi:serine hydroxymethyltransferase, partial [Leptospira interrogans serovar Pomona]|nr:serine hydroxymethyltransferase [Leptospira interrogans serovar Pomona]